MLHGTPMSHYNGYVFVETKRRAEGNRSSEQIDIARLICTHDENMAPNVVGGSSKLGVTLNIDTTSADAIAVELISPEFIKISKRAIQVLVLAHMLCDAATEIFHRYSDFCCDRVPPTITAPATLKTLQTNQRKASPKQLIVRWSH